MAIGKQRIKGSDKTLYTNVTCDQIQIAEDKLKLKLTKYIGEAKKQSDWKTWGGILLTSVASVNTAEFKYDFIFSANIWESVFQIAAIISLIMFLYSSYNALKCKIGVDQIINDLKNKE